MNRLVIDIGNTTLKAGCFNNRSLLKFVRVVFDHEGAIEEALLKLVVHEPSEVLICSVVGKKKEVEQFLKRANIPFKYFQHGDKIPIKNKYETPETLGLDRLANAVAANAIYPNKPVVVIDAGTCIKFDFITRNNEFFGGSIAPGIDMRFKALHQFTNRLPLLSRSEMVYLIGKNTTEAIQSGVINGALAEVKGILEQYQMTHKDLQVILTGGDCALLERSLKSSVLTEPWLTLKGLNELFYINEA
jgi:type III pantothenate kinase